MYYTWSISWLVCVYLSVNHVAGVEVRLSEVPEVVQAGTSVMLNCTISDFASDEVTWKHADMVLFLGTSFDKHPLFNIDDLGRPRWSITEDVSSGSKKSTLTVLHVYSEVVGAYTCSVGTVSDSVSFAMEDMMILAPKRERVVLTCDGAEIENLNLTSTVTWRRTGSSDELTQCGAPSVTSTSTTTSTSTPSTTTRTTAEISPLVTPDSTLLANSDSSLFGNTTTVAISRRSADRVECVSPFSIAIDPLEQGDDDNYTCSYSFQTRIESVNKNKMGQYDWRIQLKVLVEPVKPSKPWQVEPDYNSVTLKWSISGETLTNSVDYFFVEHASNYTYTQSQGNRFVKNLAPIDKRLRVFKITGLSQSEKFVARVVSVNAVGSTASEVNMNLTTTTYKPEHPSLYHIEESSTSIKFYWTKGGSGDVTYFLLKFFHNTTLWRSDNVTALEGHMPDDVMEHTYAYELKDLPPLTPYCVILQAVYGNTTSDSRDCVKVSTDIATPEAPNITNVTTISIVNMTATVQLVFRPPDCFFMSIDCLYSYLLQYTDETNKSVNVAFLKEDAKSIDSGSSRAYKLTNLPRGHTYEIRLAGQVQSKRHINQSLPKEPPPWIILTGEFSAPKFTQYFPAYEVPSETTVSQGKTTIDHVQDGGEQTIIIVIISVVIGIIIVCILIIVIFYKKHKERGNLSVELDDDLWIDLNTPLLAPATMGYVENVYENIGIDQWAEHCREMHANSDIKFTEEYESILKTANIDTTWRDSLEPANIAKNRYNNIVAYDHSRVVLKTLPGVVHSDYINANYIDSYDKTRMFIATQGPLPNTIEDFWRMIWENGCNVIVMITNVYEKHKKKCEQYWPDSGETKYGRLTVSFLGVEELAHWTIRRFTIKNTKVSKKKHHIEKVIVQYHYTEWPDHGIPEYTLPVLSFVKRACAASPPNSGPIVVHCSAGVGRTGTFIVLEAMMKQITQKRSVNVQGFLKHIRTLRNHMVQTEDQYIFIHYALLNFIECAGRTDIQPKKFHMMIDELDSNFDSSGETVLEKQYKTIVKWSPPTHLTTSALLDINSNKNRSLSFIPLDNSSRVKLPKVAGENGSDYINATYLHGHFQNKEFIVTQHPAAHTEYDFWRMVWDQNSMTIVMLTNMGGEDLVTFFRPKGTPTDWAHKSSFKLTFTNEDLGTLDYIVRDFQLESTQDDYEMLTRMFSITCWPEAFSETESYADGVFQFIEVVNRWHATKRNQTGPIIVIDKYGGKEAAQFCALYSLYNQYHNDTSIDIYSLAYLYHMKRPGVWESQDDYRLLYTSMRQLCEPSDEDDKLGESNRFANGDYAANTFAIVRRINTIPRSPEHITRTDTL
ncbi:tyrosine-protein phosphatase 99A-like isoform X2 [Watersipora subatra]|uniref:tyrosine-protein phosphatase 99A-like isoform X2 n=1 Tax=Watersipora subatra TaxID=2589382 RepID=UPI00355C37FC